MNPIFIQIHFLNEYKKLDPESGGPYFESVVMAKTLTDCQHEAEPICNWLLHYLYTFFDFYESRNLDNFTHPNQIIRYRFDDQRLLRERIRDLQETVLDIGLEKVNTFGRQLQEISNNLEKMDSHSNENLKTLGKILKSIQNIDNSIKNLPVKWIS